MSDKIIRLQGDDLPEDITEQEYFDMLQLYVLARTLWGEARGEGREGMQGVANVILNRAAISDQRDGFWWGRGIVQICQKPYQFSCWNRSDPNYKKLQQVDMNDPSFALALEVAHQAISGCLTDIVNGATHYHADSIQPFWARGQKPCAQLGAHIFYRLS